MRLVRLVPAALALLIAGGAPAQVKEKKSLTLEGAKAAIAAVAAEAARLNVGGAIAVVDDGGNVICVERLEGTFAAGTIVAAEKARTAAQFQRPTRVFEEAIRNGRTSLVAVSAMTPLQGGVPILVDGQVVGAIGVSGAASAQQDDEFAILGAAAVTAAMADARTTAAGGAKPVTFIDHAAVKEGFAKGAVLVNAGAYQVHASHRDAAGQAEVHVHETDIIHVLKGRATFVTGGTVVDPKQTGPGEIRGASIAGGETRELVPGDVIIVPSGVPHWFAKLGGAFDYYVVKVRDGQGGVS